MDNALFIEFFNNRWYIMVSVAFYLIFFIAMNNEILYFFFFADKPKSFKKNIKKSIIFFIDYFLGLYTTANI